jgi:aromatic ring-cleaving dioxygenase
MSKKDKPVWHLHLHGEHRFLVASRLLAPETHHPIGKLIENEDKPVGPHVEAQIGIELEGDLPRWASIYLDEVDGLLRFSALLHPTDGEDEVLNHMVGQWWGKELELNLLFFKTGIPVLLPFQPMWSIDHPRIPIGDRRLRYLGENNPRGHWILGESLYLSEYRRMLGEDCPNSVDTYELPNGDMAYLLPSTPGVYRDKTPCLLIETYAELEARYDRD